MIEAGADGLKLFPADAQSRESAQGIPRRAARRDPCVTCGRYHLE